MKIAFKFQYFFLPSEIPKISFQVRQDGKRRRQIRRESRADQPCHGWNWGSETGEEEEIGRQDEEQV